MVEALSLNIPVVSTDCDTGPREVLVGELSKYLAIVNNPDNLALKIDLALDSYPKDLDKYLLKFDKNKIANMFIDYLEKI
jgi:glycosyltransferase involved in cell wall biosynthesis